MAGDGTFEIVSKDKPWKSGPKTKKLIHLIWHLRNATAHGRFRFDGVPDSPLLQKVTVIVEDKHPESSVINWRAHIGGKELYEFCIYLAKRIEESIDSGDSESADGASD